MHHLKTRLKEHIKEYEERASKGKLASTELQHLHMLTDTLKNIYKIEMAEEYSDEAYGRKRDSMGRYSRGTVVDDEYPEGMHSRGYNSKEEMMSRIEEMRREIERM